MAEFTYVSKTFT